MDEPIVVLEIRAVDGNRRAARSPGPGWWSGSPQPGAMLGPGTTVGWLEVRNRRYRLVMPESAMGRLVGGLPAARRVAVEFGQPLFEFVEVAAGESDPAAADPAASRLGLDPSLPGGCRAVVAPTAGVFYRRPSPGAPPFVAAGDRISSGQTIGLVEVMKTFNQIAYGGPGLPETADVVEVRAGDAEEVQAGQVLVVVR